MEIRRTANAGVLLTLDDTKILLDGVCREVDPYPATPREIAEQLMQCPPDVLLFTHCHPDHFDPVLAGQFARPVYGPMQLSEQMSVAVNLQTDASVGNVRIRAIPTRHMGHYGKTTQHQSYVVEGSQILWFMGDASPMELKKLSSYQKPDVLLVPYPYISTPAAMKLVEQLLPCKILLLHLPARENDPVGIYESMEEGAAYLKEFLSVPELGETLNL